MARKKSKNGAARRKGSGDGEGAPMSAGAANAGDATPPSSSATLEHVPPQEEEEEEVQDAEEPSGCCASGACGSEQVTDLAVNAGDSVAKGVVIPEADSTCGGGGSSTPETSSCCSKKAKAEKAAPSAAAAAADGCCGGVKSGGDTCCASKEDVAVPNGNSEAEGGSCCAAKTDSTPVSTGCSSKSNGAAKAGGDSCCASKAKATPVSTGCGSKTKAGGDSCCAPQTETSVASTDCGSKSNGKPKAGGSGSCCAPKKGTGSPVAASNGCGGAVAKAKSSGGSCCAPKKVEVASKGCCGVTKLDACCAAKASVALERKSSNSHPDRVRERLFDRVTEFKNERGASMAPTAVRKAGGLAAARPVATLRLAIGGMTCSGCCTRIEKFMVTRPGIHGVTVSLLTSRGVFEFDPSVISAQAVEDMVSSLGFTAGVLPDESLVSLVLHIGYENPGRACDILLGINGVVSAKETTDIPDSSEATPSSLPKAVGGQRAVVVDYDPDQTGARKIVRHLSRVLGFQVYASSPRPLAVQNEEVEVAKFKNYLLASFLLALPIVFIEYVLPVFATANPADRAVVTGLSYKDAVGMVCATPILFIVAYPIHESAFLALRFGSRVTMDVLISLSSFTAYTFSVVTVLLGIFGLNPGHSETFFEVTALLVTLILVGRYIEKIVKAKASNSVDALLRIQAKTAILLENANEDALLKESYIDVILVERDDLLRVLPGTRIPTDGVVVEGASTVDESMVTGESRKVPKEVGSTVIGGTINAHGVLVVRVTHTITESMLARIVNLVDEAQATKCVSQTLADVVASYFTTFIISISVVMFVVWYHLARSGGVDTHGWAPLPFALRFAITILVISCPCAISLAVPTAIMVSTTIGSQFGVLFKGGIALEALEKVDAVMFDKTGTLTSGNLSVVDSAFASDDVDARQMWSYVAAAEKNSEHAIGKALVAHAQQLRAPDLAAHTFNSVPGCGVTAEVDGRHVSIGSFKWMQSVRKIAVPVALDLANAKMQRRGCVVVCVAVQHELVAVVALRDTPRPEARFVIEQLKRQKIQPWIVTGDQRETALAIAEMLGIPEFTVIADALPHQKVEKVRLLQSIGKNVAFVGDGVNDGPALAMAHVGVAVGTGTDVAIESADLVLVKDDLRDLLNALDLSRATNRMIKWNFSWGFAYNVLMMPLACGALYPHVSIPPALAGLSELLSSVPVILFSLLLNLWRPPHKSSDDVGTDNPPVVVIQVDTTEKTPLLAKH